MQLRPEARKVWNCWFVVRGNILIRQETHHKNAQAFQWIAPWAMPCVLFLLFSFVYYAIWKYMFCTYVQYIICRLFNNNKAAICMKIERKIYFRLSDRRSCYYVILLCLRN